MCVLRIVEVILHTRYPGNNVIELSEGLYFLAFLGPRQEGKLKKMRFAPLLLRSFRFLHRSLGVR